jgi:hypothetical protein
MTEGTNVELMDQLAGPVEKVYLPRSRNVGTQRQHDVTAKVVDPAVRAMAEEYFESPDRLFGDSFAATTLLEEKPIHRMMIYLHASGATIQDIATQCGYKPNVVGQILRQPWARARLVQILNENGRDHVKHFLTHEVSPSLEVLREIRDNPKTKDSSRIAAANSILDRALGKATVHVESKTTVANVPAEAARLDAEIASVRKQLASKGVTDGQPATN